MNNDSSKLGSSEVYDFMAHPDGSAIITRVIYSNNATVTQWIQIASNATVWLRDGLNDLISPDTAPEGSTMKWE